MSDLLWEPIRDLPPEWKGWIDPDLHVLAESWAQRYQHIKTSAELKEFNERLCRQWAIETGIIERVYTLFSSGRGKFLVGAL